MEDFEKKIKKLIQLNLIRDIQLAMLKIKGSGLIISEEIMNEILVKIEAELNK